VTWHPAFFGFVDRNEASELLKDCSVGCFMIRFSDSSPGHLALAYVCEQGSVAHTKIECLDHGYRVALLNGQNQTYPSLEELVRFYSILA
jgi:hypothetical protein